MQFQVADSFTGQAYRNTLHFYTHDSADPVTFDVLKACANSAAVSDLIGAYKQLLTSGARLDAVLFRQPRDPLHPTDLPAEYLLEVDEAGTRTADGDLPAEYCAILRGETDTASRRARGHLFLPPALDKASLATHGDFGDASVYYSACVGLIDQLLGWLFTAGGSHVGGAANDFDLATYSRRARAADEPYLFRWTGMRVPHRAHWLRSRTPEL